MPEERTILYAATSELLPQPSTPWELEFSIKCKHRSHVESEVKHSVGLRLSFPRSLRVRGDIRFTKKPTTWTCCERLSELDSDAFSHPRISPSEEDSCRKKFISAGDRHGKRSFRAVLAPRMIFVLNRLLIWDCIP